jgi:hypothetical protein
MTTSTRWIALTSAVAAALLGGCTSQQQTSGTASEVVDKTFALTPSSPAVDTALLKGQFTDLKVVERVEKDTGRIVDAPKLQGKLKLKNASSDHAVRLVSGRIEYVDATGKPIALVKDRGDTTFKFYSYGADRLDPGMEATFDVDVPFPTGALTAKSLANIRLVMTYTDIPYRQESVAVPVSLSARAAAR